MELSSVHVYVSVLRGCHYDLAQHGPCGVALVSGVRSHLAENGGPIRPRATPSPHIPSSFSNRRLPPYSFPSRVSLAPENTPASPLAGLKMCAAKGCGGWRNARWRGRALRVYNWCESCVGASLAFGVSEAAVVGGAVCSSGTHIDQVLCFVTTTTTTDHYYRTNIQGAHFIRTMFYVINF